MPAIPIAKSAPETPYTEVNVTGGALAPAAAPVPADPLDLTNLLAAGTLVAGGILLLSGRRRAAAAVAAAGTAFVLLEEQEAVRQWWERLPGYVAGAQEFIERVEGYMQEISTQGHRLQDILRRQG